jgi:hypothetical protein
VPIETLVSHGLPQSLVVRLGEASLTTIGLLADFTNAGKRLTDLDGVGEAKAEKIEQALERFWSEWKAPEPESEPEPAAESEGAVIDPDFDVVDNEESQPIADLTTAGEPGGFWRSRTLASMPGISGMMLSKLDAIGFHTLLGDLADAVTSGVALEDFADPYYGDHAFTKEEAAQLRDVLREAWKNEPTAAEAFNAIEPEGWRHYRIDFAYVGKGKSKQLPDPRYVEAHNILEVLAWTEARFKPSEIAGIEPATKLPEGVTAVRVIDFEEHAAQRAVEATEPEHAA